MFRFWGVEMPDELRQKLRGVGGKIENNDSGPTFVFDLPREDVLK